MAEYYISTTASGIGAGTVGDPWTIPQFYAGCAAGDIGWVKADGTYTIPTDITTSASGSTTGGPVRLIGYSATPGDGYLGRDAAGKLVTTNYPFLDLSGFRLRPAAEFHTMENLRITGASGINLLSLATNSLWLSCKIDNTSSGLCISGTALGYLLFINNDFSSATGNCIGNGSNGWRFINNRFTANGGTGAVCNGLVGAVIGNVFDGCLVGFSSANNTSAHTIMNNTFFNCGTGISLTNNNNTVLILNNIFRDVTTRINHTNISYLINNRSIEVTTMNSGTNRGYEKNNITTAGDDFINSAIGNFYLLSGSPARDAGLMPFQDIGAMRSAVTPGEIAAASWARIGRSLTP